MPSLSSISSYRSDRRLPPSIRPLVREIAEAARDRAFTLMEVCGTHTVAIFRSGIRSLLPDAVRLVSGPGCPVCVTPVSYIDRLIAYARLPGTVIATFGDLMKVPGSRSSLGDERSRGADVRLIYSPLDSLRIAAAERGKRVILAAVGFETTMPAVAAGVLEARERGLDNYFILSGGRMIPPAMEALLLRSEQGPAPCHCEDVERSETDEAISTAVPKADCFAPLAMTSDRKTGEKTPGIDGFICPGHVSVVIGARPYERIARRHGIPCAIAGFETRDILLAVLALIRMIGRGEAKAINLYPRAVREEGNEKARTLLGKVFRPGDAPWRGLGTIPRSGFYLKREFRRFDAEREIPLRLPASRENPRCLCGEVLAGRIEPPSCPAFARRCSPDRPLGPCMVSSEGTCAAWFSLSRGPEGPRLRTRNVSRR
jgi:hydrogenase expression/formation protein HypD